jgi:hypothetical protein
MTTTNTNRTLTKLPSPPPASSNNINQQPPPLPPLPPSLASKYNLNKALYLECVEPFSTSNNILNNNSNAANASSKPLPINNCETNSLDSDFGGSSYTSQSDKGKDQSTDSTDFRIDRQIKCTSTCSDIDLITKNYNSVPHIDTPSEATSISGGDLSGEIYASPTLTSTHENVNNTTNIMNSNTTNNKELNAATATAAATITVTAASASLLMSTSLVQTDRTEVNSIATIDNNSITTAQILTESTASTAINDYAEINNGLLSIDLNKTAIERSASFIDNKYTDRQKLSRSSTVNSNVNLENSLNNSVSRHTSISTYSK